MRRCGAAVLSCTFLQPEPGATGNPSRSANRRCNPARRLVQHHLAKTLHTPIRPSQAPVRKRSSVRMSLLPFSGQTSAYPRLAEAACGVPGVQICLRRFSSNSIEASVRTNTRSFPWLSGRSSPGLGLRLSRPRSLGSASISSSHHSLRGGCCRSCHHTHSIRLRSAPGEQ